MKHYGQMHRYFSFFLALVLVIGLAPVGLAAGEGEQAAYPETAEELAEEPAEGQSEEPADGQAEELTEEQSEELADGQSEGQEEEQSETQDDFVISFGNALEEVEPSEEVPPERQLKTLFFGNDKRLDNGPLLMEPSFDPAHKDYTVVVPDSITKTNFYVFAELGDAASGKEVKAKFTETDNKTEKEVEIKKLDGKKDNQSPKVFPSYSLEGNTVTITVGGEEAYVITVVRQATLQTLKIKVGDDEVPLTPTFNSRIHAYETEIAGNVKLSVTPTARVEGTKITVDDKEVASGEPTEVTPVWAEDYTYTMTLKVEVGEAKSSDGARGSEYQIKFINGDVAPIKLEISNPPEKTEYKVGEKFDPTGMGLKLIFENGASRDLNPKDATIEPETFTEEGDQTVTLSYKNASAVVNVKVVSLFNGNGTQDNPFQLSSQKDFESLRDSIKSGMSFDGKYFKLMEDITLTNWNESIGMIDPGANTSQPANSQFHPMSGTIDGAGHTIIYPPKATNAPLFGYARHLAIHDLNIQGGYINGNGLLANYVIDYGSGSGDTSAPWTLKLDRVTIKSGTSILKSGITGGYASGANYVDITDCTVEAGVKIGVNFNGSSSNQDKIGSFVGSATGTIQNSVSYADVYGKDGVGGIAGMRGQSMSVFRIYNCQFHGSVQGQENVGGILGSGYHSTSAPNGSGADIRYCSVDGTVTGTTNVGGILGADILDQIWDNGTQYIIGNEFTGTVTGTNAVGGIIGYCRSLNRNCTIENNYFTGAASGIGRVVHIDTSAVPFGFRDDVFYFNTANYNTYSTEDWNQIYEVVDSGWESGRTPRKSIAKPNQNRDDDPLGADIGKLFRNSAGPYTKSLEISGEFKRDYIMGEALDMTGAVFTVTWSDGRVEEVPLASVKITGFDTNTPGKQTLTAAYGTTSATFTVTVTPKSSKITVTVSILGDSKHGEGGTVHTLSGGGLQTWVTARQHDADTAWTVWDLLQKVFEENGITARTSNKLDTVYIEALTRNGVTLAEFDNGPNSGWMYTYNGKHSLNGVSQQYLNDKAVIVLHYSDDYTLEEGSSDFEDADDAVKKVKDLIDAIGDNVTLDSKDKIEAARKAYNALTYAQKQQVSNYGKLQAAEAKLRELRAEADKTAAKAVEDQIDALPSPAGEADRETVAAARKAYDALTDAQKKLVKNYQKLVEAQRDIALLDATPEDIEAADAVQKLIDALPEPVKTEDKAAVEAARKAYDALTDLQKLLVTNLTKLEAAEERLSLLDALKPSLDIYAAAGEFIESLRDLTEEADLYALGMARSGHEVSGKYYEAVEDYVAEYIDESGRLHRSRSEDNSRTILVLTALGRDVTDVGGHNLLLGLSDMEYLKKQGVTGPAWALIALDSHDYEIPENPEAEEQASREKIVEYLMEEANEDGGWSISGKLSEAETTAVVLTALAGYYPEDEETGEALDEAAEKLKAVVDKGVQTLSDMQDEDGGYSALAKDGTTMEPNSESAAAVLTALSALNIDGHTDERFVKNGKSVIDALCEYSVEGGGFSAKKGEERSEGATEVAYTALTAYLRMLEGETALYDMSDVEIEAPAAEAKPLTALTEPEPTEAAPEVPETTQPPEEAKPSLWDRIVGWFR